MDTPFPYRPAKTPAWIILPSLLLLVASARAQEAASPYDHPLFTGPVHEAPAPVFDQQHLRLAVRLDLQKQRLFGDATLRVHPRETARDTLVLHAAGLTVDSVFVGLIDSTKMEARYRLGPGDSLHIALHTVQDPAASLETRLVYHTVPRRGLYFTRPSRDDPAQKRQAWTQGEPEDTRFWIPLIDTPGDKLTSELLITADSSLRVLSNGQLVDTTRAGSLTTWHYEQARPHAPYAVMLAAGDYVTLRDRADVQGQGIVPLAYWVYPERIGDAARTFGRTPEMMRFFAEYLDVPYPWERYDQIVLRRFHFGGMENTGATTLTDDVLVDARAALDEDPDGLLAHELAHQWFGNLATARYWNDIWLNEGFATYLSALFIAHRDGDDAFALRLLSLADRYFAEAEQYRRPLVWNRWTYPIQMFDAHSYQKGAWVLHLLRRRLGDEAFRSILKYYLNQHALNIVSTSDFRASIEAVTKQDLADFFATWVEGAGHPLLDVSYEYDDAQSTLTVSVAQTQEGFRVPEVFPMELNVDVHTLAETHRFSLPVEGRQQTFVFSLPLQPRFIAVDPEQDWLADVTLEQPAQAWMAQLRYAADPVSRLRAARALPAFTDDPALIIGLRHAFEQEPSAPVRAALAGLLGQASPASSVQRTLLHALADEDARVRAAALDALGGYAGEPEVHTLAYDAAQNDRSYYVQAAAVVALARTNSPKALDVVRSALVTPSHREVIRRAAFEALAHLEVPPRDGFEIARTYSTPDRPEAVRAAAAGYLQTLAGDHPPAFERLLALLDDPAVSVRRTTIRMLDALDNERARAALEAHHDTESQPMLKILIERAIRQDAPLD